MTERELPPNAYSAVFAFSILHLVNNPEALIERLWNSLEPGGMPISSTICLRDVLTWFRFVVPEGQFVGVFPPLSDE